MPRRPLTGFLTPMREHRISGSSEPKRFLQFGFRRLYEKPLYTLYGGLLKDYLAWAYSPSIFDW